MSSLQPMPVSLSVRDAALMTSLSTKEVYDRVNDGTIPARRNGRRILIDYDALVQWYRSLPTVTDASS